MLDYNYLKDCLEVIPIYSSFENIIILLLVVIVLLMLIKVKTN